MQRILTVNEMQLADKFTIETLGVPSGVLVERAGKAVAEVIMKRFKGGRVLVVAGKGNNGQDALVVAKELSGVHGFSVTVMQASQEEFYKLEKDYDIIVDGIFGTGLKRQVTGVYAEIINKLNDKKSFKVSIDIPSGLSGDLGKPLGIAFKADLTVAIQELKMGHFLGDGLDYSGEVVSKDIGISIWGDDFAFRLEKSDVLQCFPERKRNTHKGTYGKVAIVGGSKNYFGSVMLSALALSSLKTGAGYSHLCIPDSLFSVYAGKCPQCTLGTLLDKDGVFVFDKDGLDKLLSYNVICFGMGVTVSEQIYKTVCYLLENYTGTLILDADALNSLSQFGVQTLKNKKCKVVLTPHVKEFSRLTSIETSEILSNPIKYAKDFAHNYGVILVLKNAVSIITDGERVILNTTGNSSLAKCGSGDVLSGIIAGISARISDTLLAVASGCYVLGKSAEEASKVFGEYSTTATEIIENIYKVIT